MLNISCAEGNLKRISRFTKKISQFLSFAEALDTNGFHLQRLDKLTLCIFSVGPITIFEKLLKILFILKGFWPKDCQQQGVERNIFSAYFVLFEMFQWTLVYNQTIRLWRRGIDIFNERKMVKSVGSNKMVLRQFRRLFDY